VVGVFQSPPDLRLKRWTRVTTSYSRSFFEQGSDLTSQGARAIVPLLIGWIHPVSVVDIGCALGQWLEAFQREGVGTILGIDGDYVDRALLRIPSQCFEPRDLSRPFRETRKFDLAICLEVAEHLPAGSGDDLVQGLTAMSPAVLFSAAVPEQGGVGHINEQWPSYWIERFGKQGFVAVDCVRPRIWNDASVAWWYAQNALLYVREDSLKNYPALLTEPRAGAIGPVDLVHPRMYLGARYYANPENIRLKEAMRLLATVGRRVFMRRLGRFSKSNGHDSAT